MAAAAVTAALGVASVAHAEGDQNPSALAQSRSAADQSQSAAVSTVAAAAEPDAPEREAVADVEAPAPTPGVAEGQVLVRFAEEVGSAARNRVLAGLGLTAGPDVAETGFVLVPTDGLDPAGVVAALADLPGVAEVQPDFIRSVAAVTDDPELDYAWPYFSLTRLPRAWDETAGDGVVIAVVDTGVSSAHEDLAGAVLPGLDLVNGDTDAGDDHGHGTAVAGAAAARGNNGLGSVGSAWRASVLPVKVLDADGDGSDSTIAAGITWAASNGADVIVLPFAAPGEAPVLLTAIEGAIASGCVVVAAAGNGGSQEPLYPAAYAEQVPGMLAVGSTGDTGNVSQFTSWGDWVSLTAPGEAIVVPAWDVADEYLEVSGTSMSAGLVAGAAALLVAQGASTPADVEASLKHSARDAGPRGVDPFHGWGILDASAALGIGPSIPLDRLKGDGGTDDLPSGATPASGGATAQWATGSLSGLGDVDWRRFEMPDPGRYHISLTFGGGSSVIGFQVLNADNDVVATSADGSKVVVDGTGPWWVGISSTEASVGRSYTVWVEWTALPVPPEVVFDAAERLSPDALGNTMSWPTLVDVTGDGRLDVVGSTFSTATTPAGTTGPVPAIGLFSGTAGEGLLGRVTARLGTEFGISPHIAVADLDGDGVSEVVASTDLTTYVVRVVDGTPDAGTLLLGVPPLRFPIAGDLEGDGDVDVVGSGPDGLIVLRNDGTGDLELESGPAAGAGRLALVDLDRDGLLDVLGTGGEVWRQESDGSLVAAAIAEGLVTDYPSVADVNQDGLLDVVLGDVQVRVALALPDGGFATPVFVMNRESGAFPVGFADLNLDGLPDAHHSTTSSFRFALQRADGRFDLMPVVLPRASYNSGPCLIHDVDGDGDGDLVFEVFARGLWLRRASIPDPPPPPEPLKKAWVLTASPTQDTSGLPVRPTLAVGFGRTVDVTSVGETTVILRNAVTGELVPAERTFDEATGALSVTPATDLIRGHHYQLLVRDVRDVDGEPMDEVFRTWFTVGVPGARFTPVQPYRVMDTRNDPWGPVQPGFPRSPQVGFPVGAAAVVLNVTAVNPSSVGNVRVYPRPAAGATPPTVSNINVVPGVDQPNLVTVQLGADGRIDLATAGMSAHLVVDVAGYYAPGAATAYVPLDPRRVMDTRKGGAAPVAAGRWVDLDIIAAGNLPPDALAVVLNVTGVAPSRRTNVRVYPAPADSESQSPPTVSNLNLDPGRDQANLVTVMIGDGGRVRFYTQSAVVHLVADLAGYYTAVGDHGFVPLAPRRIADSRLGQGLGEALSPGVPAQLLVAGANGIPPDAAAAVLNVTAVSPDRLSNVRAYPYSPSGGVPLISNLNVVRGRDEANLSIVRIGEGGRVGLFSQSARLHMVVDASGYFAR